MTGHLIHGDVMRRRMMMAVLLMRLEWMMTVMMIIMTIRKIFGHLMNGSFGKEKIKEIMKVKKIERENKNAKK